MVNSEISSALAYGRIIRQ